MDFLHKNRKIVIDFMYSILAYALPTVILQLVILPIIAKVLSADANGLFLTLLSAVRLLISVFIASLANLRLLDKEYCKSNNYEGVYNSLFILAITICVSLSAFLVWIYLRSISLSTMLVPLLTMIYCFHDYYSIQFRIEMNFKKIVIDNLLTTIGFLLGLILFYKTNRWEYVFILGYIVSCVFILFETNIWRKGISVSPIKQIAVRYTHLSSSNALNSSISYCDRLIMFPVLGGASVSVYNASSVVSKFITLLSVPIRNVMLSYIVDKEHISLKKRKLTVFIWFILLAMGLLYGTLFLSSRILCKVLYPMYYFEAQKFIPLITGAIVFESSANMFNIILLQFKSAKLQTCISFAKFILYSVSMITLIFVFRFGLYGFCFSLFICSLVKLIIILINVHGCLTVE